MKNLILITSTFLLCHMFCSAAQADTCTSVAFNAKGTRLAVGGYRSVAIYDPQGGVKLGEFSGLPSNVTAVAFSPDGKTMAVASGLPGRSGEVRIWYVGFLAAGSRRAVKQTPLVLTGPSDIVYGLAFSPDGTKIAGGSYDHDVYVWDLAKQRIPNFQPSVLKDHTDAVYSVAFSPNGSVLASGAGDRTVKFWDTKTGRRLFTLSDSSAEVYSIAFDSKGTKLVAGGADKTVRIWNISRDSGELAKSALAHNGAVLRAAFTPDNGMLVTSGEDHFVKIWDAATLVERKVLPAQPDMPVGLAIAPSGKTIAVGSQNGAVGIYDFGGKLVRPVVRGGKIAYAEREFKSKYARCVVEPQQKLVVRPAYVPKTGGPTLFQASLGAAVPSGAGRGTTTTFTLYGGLIADASRVLCDDPAISSEIVSPKDPNPGVLRVKLNIGAKTRLGVHKIYVQTPHGTTTSVPFAVGSWPEIMQKEPNNTPEMAQKVTLPCTVVGALDTPGDVDCFQFYARAGQELVFETIAQPLRSRLQSELLLTDKSGTVLARSKTLTGRPDAVLGYAFSKAGEYVIQIKDFEGAGGADVHYRLNIGELSMITDVFPFGVQSGKTTKVSIKGFNLGGAEHTLILAQNAERWGQTMEVPLPNGPAHISRLMAVGPDPEISASGTNSALRTAMKLDVPVGVSGVLDRAAVQSSSTSHFYRFTAKRGQKLIMDVQARRLGFPTDTELEILDANGKPVEQAVLRAVAQTEITLFDRDSASSGIRLFTWPGFQLNDFLMVGREVIQISKLPIGPDEDVMFRSIRGQRLGYFGTTPEFHTIGQAVYKIESHPPGTSFSPNGYPLTHVFYRNDDGGPIYGKDSHLPFTAPSDGDYFVKVSDARGQSGQELSYHLQIRPPRPDFKLTMSPEHPNIPKGGSAIVSVDVDRYDEFSGPIRVELSGLPPGIHATSVSIQPGENSAVLMLTADNDAKTAIDVAFKLTATAIADGTQIVRTIEPENGARIVSVLPPADLKVATDVQVIVLHPGEETVVEAMVDRQGNFGGRVPLEIKNLPFGVFVLHVGLNGVLVTEKQDTRSFSIYCEPWVKPMERQIYVMANVEGGVQNGAVPILLRIESAKGRRASAANAPSRR